MEEPSKKSFISTVYQLVRARNIVIFEAMTIPKSCIIYKIKT